MRPVLLTTLLALLTIQEIFGQIAPNKYRIYFKDKNHNYYSIDHPEAFLSEKALNRRTKQSIEIQENDLPVSSYYIDSLKNIGFTVLNTSKWMNTVTVYSSGKAKIEDLTKISFVRSVKKVASSEKTITSKFENQAIQSFNRYDNALNYGESGNQIRLHNGHVLHQSGYLGQGIIIAVIDAGFYNTNLLPSFDSLWANNQILDTYDFVENEESVFEDNSHGMKVLSIIGGNVNGQLIGTAPKANFLLLRSEDAATEYTIEEDNWAAAAEYADSAGADIINTSLGYTVFDDPSQNYSYSDMDGNSAFVTKAADIAASKGILVVVSAGNQGNDLWKYISAPADGDSVLTVGAVNAFASYVEFSSQGPTSDGRVKPNVAAMGFQTILQDVSGQISKGNGTSFSAPIITGLAACLWQALPDLSNIEILRRIEESAHQFSNPDYKLGYGIPDFATAANLNHTNYFLTDNIQIEAYPNPFTKEFYLFFNTDNLLPNNLNINIFNILGEKIYSETFQRNGNVIHIGNVENLSSGIYIVTLSFKDITKQIRISKIN